MDSLIALLITILQLIVNWLGGAVSSSRTKTLNIICEE